MTSCESGRFLGRCRADARALCQYCGHDFCDAHGVTLGDGQEICHRSRCQEKRADVERQAVYKEEVATRNGDRRCGEPTCRSAMAAGCSKCKGLFCGGHLEARELEEGRGLTTIRVQAVLCPRCRSRLRLWSKR